MNCPNCQAVNPEGAKFCHNCGTRLPVACDNCGATLFPGAKFCHNCGHAVHPPGSPHAEPPRAIAPPQAAPPLPAAAPVRADHAGQGQARLDQYIPRELMSKLEAARANRSMAGERRIVTVLFCDVKGSTSLAEMLDPEEWAEIMNGAFKYLIAPVYRFEGTVARLMGDAILAFFGAPIAHEDDPQRAVLAGLEIVEAIQQYRQEVKGKYGLDLNVRIGINTGLVVVGEVGSDLRVEYTAMGDAVNVASRMEQTAEPGTVQITGNTHKSVTNLFEFEPVGEIEVKGKSEPVAAYRVLRQKPDAVPTRGIEGLRSPLVGRERELALLRSRLEDLLAGRGQIVSVLGEAGLGKSRLMAELRKAMLDGTTDGGRRTTEELSDAAVRRPPSVVWLEGRSLSYETNTPYAPFIDLLDACLGQPLRGEESGDERYGKIKERVESVMEGHGEEIAPFLATLLGIEVPGEDAQRVKYIEPPALRGRIFGAVAAFFEALAGTTPTVLVFEDLHWVDSTSLELIEQLLPVTDRAPLMIIAIFRPHSQERSWRMHELAMREYPHRYTQVPLEPLDEASSRELVANLLEIEDLPEKVRTLILKKAEGNPFFVEEVIRSLLDARLVIRDDSHWRATREIETIAVPDTLAGVITARLDRLDEESKYTAQTASVIGRDFGYDVLHDVYDWPQALDGALSTLQRRELVREKSRIPRRVYLFKHVLTQETVYGSLLLSKRRELHRRVADCLERVEAERVNDIARHLLEAREEERALPYLVQAGKRASHSGAREEAINLYKRAVEIAQTVENLPLAREAYEGLGKALEFAMDVPGAVENYHQMLHYAQDRGDKPMEVSALNKVSYVSALMMGQFPEAERHLVDAEQLARESDDYSGLAELYTLKCMMCTATADFDNADRYLGEAAELGRKLDHKETTAFGLAHKANTQTHMAQFEKAWQTTQEALRVAEEIGNLEHKAEVLVYAIPFYHMHRGDMEAARQAAQEGYEIATQIGSWYSPPIGAYMLGSLAALRGEYEEAMRWYGRALDAARPIMQAAPFLVAMSLGGLGSTCLDISPRLVGKVTEYHTEALQILETPYGAAGGGAGWADLGFCALALGKIDLADRYFQNGLIMPSMPMYTQRPRLLCGAALVALASNRLDDAAHRVEEARRYAEDQEMRWSYPLVELTAGRVKAAQGNYEQALERFGQTETLSRGMEMRPFVWHACNGAAQLLSSLGRSEEAEARRADAQAAFSEMAGFFTNEKWRSMFIESASSTPGTPIAEMQTHNYAGGDR